MVEVYKFGGTCADSTTKLERITEIIAKAQKPLIVTLSAAAGVTDTLKNTLETKLDEDLVDSTISVLRKRHQELLATGMDFPKEIILKLDRLKRLLTGILYTEELTDRTYDLIMTFGERMIVPLLLEFLKYSQISCTAIDAEGLIITDGSHRSSYALLDESKELARLKIEESMSHYEVIVVPGYYGKSKAGEITTLGRSGTDYTATILAYAIDAESVTIWKDVFGFMSADPSMVPTAHTIPFLSYAEAAELAYFGAKLLHPRAASPARINNIPIYIRHIDHLDAITCINGESSHTREIIKSVSHMSNLAILKVYAAMGGNTKGVLAAISGKISEAGGNTISVATSQTCIAFLLAELEAYHASSAIKSLGPSTIDDVEIIDGVALICVVGEGLSSTPGVASRVFNAIADYGINVDLISAGASSTAYHFTVAEEDLEQGLRAIHSDFFEEAT